MTSTLRDRLAAILGPGNDDTTAYAQADAVLDLIETHVIEKHTDDICDVLRKYGQARDGGLVYEIDYLDKLLDVIFPPVQQASA